MPGRAIGRRPDGLGPTSPGPAPPQFLLRPGAGEIAGAPRPPATVLPEPLTVAPVNPRDRLAAVRRAGPGSPLLMPGVRASYDAGMSLSRDEVAHLGRLARLSLTEDELDHYTDQLGGILEAVARVGEVAAADVPPTSHPLPLSNVTRPDEVQPHLTREAALAGAPAVQDHRFRVPRILDEA